MTSPAQVRRRPAGRTLAAIQAAPHPPRPRSRAEPDPDQVLATLPRGHRDWKRILAALLAKHGHKHGIKDKGVSNRTLYERPRFLYQFFRDLHAHTIYHTVEPRCLGNRHVAAMAALWAERGLAAGTIANYRSILRSKCLRATVATARIDYREVSQSGSSKISQRTVICMRSSLQTRHETAGDGGRDRIGLGFVPLRVRGQWPWA